MCIIVSVCYVGSSKAEIQAAVLDTERRLAEKHARLEGAVVQVSILMLPANAIRSPSAPNSIGAAQNCTSFGQPTRQIANRHLHAKACWHLAYCVPALMYVDSQPVPEDCGYVGSPAVRWKNKDHMLAFFSPQQQLCLIKMRG